MAPVPSHGRGWLIPPTSCDDDTVSDPFACDAAKHSAELHMASLLATRIATPSV